MIIEVSESDGFEIFFEHVQLEVTGKCNMACPHCRAWNEARIELTPTVIRNVLEFVSSESEKKFAVTVSGGEPFIRRDLSSLIELISNYPAGLIAITTNGSLSSPKRMKEIAARRGAANIVIQVSLDGPTPADHDRFRDFAGAFDRAIGTIKMAQDSGLIPAIRATICRENIPSMEALVELACSLRVSSIGFGTVVPFGKAKETSLEMTSKKKQEFLLEVARLKSRFQPAIQIETEDPLKFAIGCNHWDLGGIDPNDELSFGGCTAGINTFNVSSDASITPCAVLPNVILNASEKNAGEIREEYAKSQIVKDLLKRSLKGKCGSCSLRRVCGGCRAIPYSLTGDLLGEDTTCWR